MKNMAKSGPAPLIDERDFFPPDLNAARRLREALVASGASIALARGVVGWLIDAQSHLTRADDPASDLTRSRYRQALARLDGPPWGPESNRDMGAKLKSVRLLRSRRRGGKGDNGARLLAAVFGPKEAA